MQRPFKNFLSKWKKGRASFLRDYTSSPIEIGLKTNLLFHVSSSFSPLLSSFFVELSFFLFFFLSAAPTVRMTEGGGVTFASYEISIGEDPSDYISPLQKRRSFFFFLPLSFWSENPEIQEVFEQERQRFHTMESDSLVSKRY